MEPLSIAYLAITGAKSFWSLADLIAAYKEVDQSVRTLGGLSRGLAQVLEHLVQSLKDPVLNAPKNADLWASVHGAVESCETTIAELDAKLEPVRASARKGMQQAWRALTLGLRQAEIDRLVSNMKTHSINLQLALQTVNVIITASIPGAVAADQAGRFDRLERMMAALRLRMDAPGQPATIEAENHGLLAVEMDQNTTELLLSARSVVTSSRAETVGSSSSTSAQPVASRSHELVFEDYASVGPPAPMTAQPSEAQSLDEEHRAQIHDWILQSPSDVIPEDESEIIPLDEDYDADFEFKVTAAIFEEGLDYYAQQRYPEAQENFRRGLERAKQLPASQKEELRLGSMQFHHALSCLAQNQLDEARESFHVVAVDSLACECNLRLRCLALYQLARVHVRLTQHGSGRGGDEALEAAEKYCKQAVGRMWKDPSVWGENASFHGALILLSLVYWARGKRIDARATTKLLPHGLQIPENEFASRFALAQSDQSLVEPLDNHQEDPSRGVSESSTANILDTNHPSTLESSAMRRPSVRDEKIIISTPSIVPRSAHSQSNSLDSTRGSAVKLSKSSETATESNPSLESSSIKYYNAAAAADIIRRKGFKKQVTKGLYWAAQNGNLDVLNVLLNESSAQIDARKAGFLKNKDTLLRTAAVNGHYAICERLLAANAAIDAMVEGQTALDAAIDKGQVEICRLLLDRGADADGQVGQRMTPLLRAVNSGNQAIRELVASSVSSIDDPRFADTRESLTPLMHAAAYNKTKTIRWLLELGANPDGPNCSVTTPLIEAARANSIEACRILLSGAAEGRGAHVHLSTAKGVTAARAATGWLKKFLLAWPESRDWRQPEYTMSIQP